MPPLDDAPLARSQGNSPTAILIVCVVAVAPDGVVIFDHSNQAHVITSRTVLSVMTMDQKPLPVINENPKGRGTSTSRAAGHCRLLCVSFSMMMSVVLSTGLDSFVCFIVHRWLHRRFFTILSHLIIFLLGGKWLCFILGHQ